MRADHQVEGKLVVSKRLNSIVIVPRDVAILRNVFDPFMIQRAREEVITAIGEIPQRSDEVPVIYARQRGVRVSKIDPRLYIKLIVRDLERFVGLRCDQSKCSAREQNPTGDFKLNWHQDVAGMDLVEGQDAMIAWVPLDPIDGHRPSIEIGPAERKCDHIRDNHRFLVIGGDPKIYGDPIEDLCVGDVVLFTPYVLHRTHCTSAMKETRYSLDLRFYGHAPTAPTSIGGAHGSN